MRIQLFKKTAQTFAFKEFNTKEAKGNRQTYYPSLSRKMEAQLANVTK